MTCPAPATHAEKFDAMPLYQQLTAALMMGPMMLVLALAFVLLAAISPPFLLFRTSMNIVGRLYGANIARATGGSRE